MAIDEKTYGLDAPESIPSDARGPTSSRSHRLRRGLFTTAGARRVVVPVAIIAVWAGVSYSHLVGSLYIPSPTEVWNSFKGMESDLGSAIQSSVTMVLIGFGLGTSIGVLMGLAMAYSRATRQLFGGVFDFLRPVPVFALIPLFVLWFGVGKAPQIALIALGCSIILGVTTIEAVHNVHGVYIRAALTLGASRRHIYRTVILPEIFPHLLGAIRVAAAASWGLDVAAEFIGSQNGLGYMMTVREQYLDTAGIIVIVLIYSFLALGLDILIRRVEKPLTKWTDRGTQTGVVAMVLGRA